MVLGVVLSLIGGVSAVNPPSHSSVTDVQGNTTTVYDNSYILATGAPKIGKVAWTWNYMKTITQGNTKIVEGTSAVGKVVKFNGKTSTVLVVCTQYYYKYVNDKLVKTTITHNQDMWSPTTIFNRVFTKVGNKTVETMQMSRINAE